MLASVYANDYFNLKHDDIHIKEATLIQLSVFREKM